MGNRQPNFTTHPTEQTLRTDAADISAALPPSPAVSPPSVSLPPPADPSNAPYKVFISHAGEDKVNIAFPLRDKLAKHGITAFVDKKDMAAGMEATSAMIHAMQTATIAVIVMSPEFVARKWPMKELMHFLSRLDECRDAGHEGPTIIPFFYRLSISELYDEPRMDRSDEDGNQLYEKSRFYERQQNREPEASIAGIKAALKKLHGIMGVENVANASNHSSYGMHLKREMILDKLCDKICHAALGSTVPNAIKELVQEAEHDVFRAHFDKAYDASDLIFDFDRKDDDGEVCTQEGKILQMILDDSMDRNRAIAVRGIGGVGKTSLLRKIQSSERVFERFKGGVYFVEVGKDATRDGLKEVLISMVMMSGGKQTASKMRSETDMRKVMEAFRSWFSQKQCLFMIDDVWNTTEVTRGIIRDLRKLHTTGRDSKTLLTTRSIDIATYGSAYVSLNPRRPLDDESRAILYHYAGLKLEQGQKEDHKSVNEILERCAGLPLLLCVAGKSVKTLSFRPGHEGCEAYRFYAEQLKTSMGEMVSTETESYEGLSTRLKMSIELVEERRKSFDFRVSCSMAKMHRRLSVMKKQMRVPMRMLKHLWEVKNERQASWIAKEFEQVGLADVEFEKQKCKKVEVLRLHDSVYEFAVYETKLCNEERVGHRKVVEGYRTELRMSDEQREWWSESLEDDKYIHGNVCRHLKEGGFEEELFGLLLSPEWLERQVGLNGVVFAEGDFSVGIEAVESRPGRAGNREGDETEEALQTMKNGITLSSSYILRNGRELWFQVHGRLKRAGERNKLVREYVRRIESDAPKPRLLCMNGMLVEPGGANTRIITVGSKVCCIVVLKDGERVACGCLDGDIVIVNVHRSEIEMRWRAHKDRVRVIDVGKDGMQVLSGSWDKATKLWDVQSGQCLATLDGHSDDVTRVAITQDGKRVVSCSNDGEVQVWDIENRQRVGPSFKKASMRSLAVFKDGKRVVMSGRHAELEIWNVLTNTKVGASFHGHTSEVECAAMTGDESRLVSGSRDRTVRIWEVEGCGKVGNSFEGHNDCVSCVATSDDGLRVVSGSDDMKVRVWDVASGEQVCDAMMGHTSGITGVSFMGEKDTIVSCSDDGTVRMWNVNKKKEETKVDKHSGPVASVSFTPSGRFVVSGSWDGTIRMWDAISGKTVGEPLLHVDSVCGVAVSPDGRLLVSTSYDGMVRVCDLQTRALVHTFKGHTDDVSCVTVTSDGDRAVTGSWDQTVRVWDLKSMNGSHIVLEGHSATVWSVFVTDDRLRIISVDLSDSIFVWDIETRMSIKSMRQESAHAMSRRQVLGLAGEGTIHDEAGLSIAREGFEIVHGEGSEARVLGTLESDIWDWDIAKDKRTICVGLEDGRVGFLRLEL